VKVMVTGGAGFIGSHVVDQLILAGHQVVVVDNLSTGRRSNVNPQAILYPIDIRSPELHEVFEKEQPEVISHHAAQIDVGRSLADPFYDAEINVLGSLRLLECAREFKARKLIFISSGGAVYGEPRYLPCDENHPAAPLCPYGASKYAVEIYLHFYGETYGLDYTILRYANVYGPRQSPAGEAGVVAIFTRRMLRGDPITINGTGEQMRDFVYAGDCARANVLVLEQGARQVFNLGTGQATSINEVCHQLQLLTHYPLRPQYGPARPGEIFCTYLDTRRARTQLGWKPEVELSEGLLQTVAAFQGQI